MDQWLVVLIPAIAALVASLVGLYKSWSTGKVSAKKNDLDVLREIVDNLQTDNTSMRAKCLEYEASLADLNVLLEALKVENEGLHGENETMDLEIADLKVRLRNERDRRAALSAKVNDLIAENMKLHQYIGELRESVRRKGALPPEARKMMMEVPGMCAEVASLAKSCEGCPPELVKAILEVAEFVLHIPVLANNFKEEQE